MGIFLLYVQSVSSMTRLYLCVCTLLCVLLCLDTTEGEKTSKLSKVKGVISSFKKPSSSGPATSSAGTYKEKIKKLNTKENKDKTKKAAKKLKTKKKTPVWVIGLVV